MKLCRLAGPEVRGQLAVGTVIAQGKCRHDALRDHCRRKLASGRATPPTPRGASTRRLGNEARRSGSASGGGARPSRRRVLRAMKVSSTGRCARPFLTWRGRPAGPGCVSVPDVRQFPICRQQTRRHRRSQAAPTTAGYVVPQCRPATRSRIRRRIRQHETSRARTLLGRTTETKRHARWPHRRQPFIASPTRR